MLHNFDAIKIELCHRWKRDITMNSPKSPPPTYFQAWLERKNIPWVVVIIVLPSMIFFSELPYGLLLNDNGVERNGVYASVIIAYSLISVAITRYFLNKVIISLQPLTDDFKLDTDKKLNFEWQLALIVSVSMTFLSISTMPKLSGYEGGIELWLFAGGTAIANAVLGWILFMLTASVTHITKIVSSVVVVDIFDTTPFYPVAQWCLAVAITIMGVVTIATLFLQESILTSVNLATYTIALLVGIFVFFAGMWSTHQLMQKNKKGEIKKLNHQLSKLHIEILSRMERNELEQAEPFLTTSARLSTHKKLVEEIPVWPYTMGNLGGLLTSVSIPVIINIVLRFF